MFGTLYNGDKGFKIFGHFREIDGLESMSRYTAFLKKPAVLTGSMRLCIVQTIVAASIASFANSAASSPNSHQDHITVLLSREILVARISFHEVLAYVRCVCTLS